MKVYIPKDMDWCNLDHVIALANKLSKGGRGQTVIADTIACCYRVTFTSTRDRWDKPHLDVMYQTI